jgi:hypothetical protein
MTLKSFSDILLVTNACLGGVDTRSASENRELRIDVPRLLEQVSCIKSSYVSTPPARVSSQNRSLEDSHQVDPACCSAKRLVLWSKSNLIPEDCPRIPEAAAVQSPSTYG